MAKTYGRWRVESMLGEGGQGHAFLVTDQRQEFAGNLVLKRLKNRESPARLARFSQEARVLQKLEHSNILRLVDFDVEGDEPYIVTEFCDGGTLEEAAIDNFTYGRRLEICIEVAKALGEAHKAGVVYRDLKPSNVF